MLTFGLFGDSYIERLRRYCDGNLTVHGRTEFFAMGGLRTDRMDQGLLERLLEAHVDVVVINVGGNDIRLSSSPTEIFRRICTLVETIQSSGVAVVYVNEILTRGNFSKCPGLSKSAFDRRRKKINGLLYEKYGQHFVRFKDIKYPTDYLPMPDLVHLNTHRTDSRRCGLRKFECRISRILRRWEY